MTLRGRIIHTAATAAASGVAEVPGGAEPLRAWRDRLGSVHRERRPAPYSGEPRAMRVTGPLEREWTPGCDAASLTRAALARPHPHIASDPDHPGMAIWTWVVEEPDARAVVLWTNPVFDHEDVGRMELTRLPGSDLWTISLRLPASLRASYRIGAWREDGPPPWRVASGRRGVILAAMGASAADPRAAGRVRGSRGEVSSVAAGPTAPPELWRGAVRRTRGARVDDLVLSEGRRAWVYAPEGERPTPLLVLFDGQVWKGMGLPSLLDAAIAAGVLPPLHVALLDSGDQAERWADLGVPGAQVDVVVDDLLPRVRARWNVDPRGRSTLVAGQSLGGLAALWTLALSAGEVQHAIAQSPSLWRFAIADALLAERRWRSIALHAGTFEADMLAEARALAGMLRADTRCGGRPVQCTAFAAGHDWAVWRANLVGALADLLPAIG